jgi:single-strand DNA-binding protein
MYTTPVFQTSLSSGLVFVGGAGPSLCSGDCSMANLNKVMLIGRLTRDPETRSFANGGKVANFGFAVNNRKKNQTTGEWEEDPVFVDVKAFNREKGRQMADLVGQYLKKGQQAYLEGHLVFEQWNNQEGQKQSKLKVVLDDLQFLEPRTDGGMGSSRGAPMTKKPAGPASPEEGFDEPTPSMAPESHTEEEIPF